MSHDHGPECGCGGHPPAPVDALPPGVAARIGIGLIRVYRYTLSAVMGRQCRHLPTCSDYGETAIRRFGLWYGGWMTLARILRCNPFGSSGFDPVPETLPDDVTPATPWRAARWTGAHIDPATRLDR